MCVHDAVGHDQDTFDRILAGARALLERGGSDALGIRQVAKETGLSTGTVTYYFKNRDALIEGLLESHHSMLESFHDSFVGLATEHADEPMKALREILGLMYHACRDNRAVIALVQITYIRQGKLPPRRAGIIPRLAALYAPFVGVSPVQLGLLAQTVTFTLSRYATMDEAELCATVGKDPEELEDAHDAVLAHLVNLVQYAVAGWRRPA